MSEYESRLSDELLNQEYESSFTNSEKSLECTLDQDSEGGKRGQGDHVQIKQDIITNWHKTRLWLSGIPSPTINASRNKLLETYKPERGAEVVEILLNMEATSEAFDEECNYTDESIIKKLIEDFTDNKS